MNHPTTPTETAGATRELAAFAAGLRYEDIPPEVIAKAKACVLDTLGCMIFGATLPWTRIVAQTVAEEGGEAQASLIGLPARATVSQAAMVNAASGHGFELDDAHTRASMHAGSIAVAAGLAISEWRGASGRDFLVAVVAGYEAGLRVGIAGAGGIFKRGFHSAAVCGGFVGAATTARLLGLDADRAQHAFGIVGSLGAGLVAAQEGAMVKRFHAGQAARNGVTAAMLARNGFTGILNVLEAPFGGFLSSMSDRADLPALTAGLGSKWEVTALGFKAYATAGAAQPGVALLAAIMKEHKLAADAIERIEVDCTTHCRDHVAWPYVPQGAASAQLNLYYALSVMALEGAAMVEQFEERKLADPRILDYMRRITIKADAGFDAKGNAFRYATRVAVTTKGGTRHVKETLYRPGSPEAPLTEAQLVEKFDLLASKVVKPDARERIKANIGKLETLAKIEALVADLRGAT